METQTYKLLLFFPVWKRPEITEICFQGVNRLQKSGLFPIDAFVVISEESMIPLCEKYDIKYCFYKNEPLGEKKNYGLSKAMELEWDYMIEIGSDDLLFNSYLTAITPYLGVRDFFGIGHIIFMNSEDLTCRRIVTRHPIGMGRVMSRKVVEKLGKIWSDEKHKGQDNNSYWRVVNAGFIPIQINSEKPLGIDIKSEVNFWPFNYFIGKEYSFEDAVSELSQEEIESIKRLYVEVEA